VAAVIDGLGHGEAARVASRSVVDTLDSFTFGTPDGVARAVEVCHDAARSTRGAVMAVAHVGLQGAMTWTGVGNIEGFVCQRSGKSLRATDVLVSQAGVVGYQLPRLHVREVAFVSDSVLVMHTDGISQGWLRGLSAADTTEVADLADLVVDRFADGHDDSCIFVGWFEAAGNG